MALAPGFEHSSGHKRAIGNDPAAGGSSGICLWQLFDGMGIAAQLGPKAVLEQKGMQLP